MKILHTSDWHLGQNFYRYDRREEHAYMVGQLRSVVAQEQPDVLVIAGDVYDVAAPGTSVMKDFARYMIMLHDACPQMAIVCISGNHDSSSRHEIWQEPWEVFNVYTIGRLNLDDLRENVVRIKDKGYVVAVPYTNERFLGDDFYARLEEAVGQVCGGDDLPIVFAGHSSISDCDYDGHFTMCDNRYIGNIECASVDSIGKSYDYIALGHIHKAQTFYDGRARYSGSPLAVSFDEVKPGYEHGFTIVEIASRGDRPQITTCEAKPLVPLVNIPAVGFGTWKDVMNELSTFPADKEAYIRLNVELQPGEMLPSDREIQIANTLNGKAGRYCAVNISRVAVDGGPAKGVVRMELEELQKEDSLSLIKKYLESEGIPFSSDFEDMFNEAVEAVNSVQDEN